MHLGLERAVTAELASSVQQRAEGNPLYINAVIAMLSGAELGSAPPLDGAQLCLPLSLRLAGERQLDCLPSACRRLLRFAAVFGREFDLDTLARCPSALAIAAELEPQLVAACQQRVLRRVPIRERRYRFTHAVLREILEQELDATTRSCAHREAAQALAPADGRFEPRSWCRIAHHWLHSEGVEALELAAGYADRAARGAEGRGAHAEAAAAFEIVVAAQRKRIELDPPPADSPRLHRVLGRQLLALGAALWRAGQLNRALGRYFEAASIGQKHADDALLADATLASLADCCMMLSPDQLALCEAACRVSGTYPRETRIRLLAGVGAELCFHALRARGAALIDEATRLAADCPEPEAQLAVRRARRLAFDERASLEERRTLLEQRAAVATSCRDDKEYAWAHAQLLRSAIESADPAAVRAHFETFCDAARSGGEPLQWFARLQACTLASLRGRFDEATALAHEARQIGREVPNSSAAFYGQAATLAQLQGQGDEALRMLRRAVDQFDHPDVRLTLAAHYAELGRLAESRVELERARASAPDSIYALCLIAQVAHHLGDVSIASDVHERLTRFDSRCAVATGGVLCVGAVAHFAGIAALTAGRPRRGRELLATALGINSNMGALPALARTHFELARVSHHSPAEAVRHAREALQLFQALAMPDWVRRAEQLCAELERAAATNGAPDEAPIAEQTFLRHGPQWQLCYRGRSVEERT